ncbi:hypothetical protein DYB30_011997 [Aphanomyces astaci]|uniref:Uncharacterized protein n=2 Tax=Aphanomyces astaci TaxID=112090 RepID=A0A397CQI3_APHAT|nr:hypothetical protein DYB30_011997 [Aphanomyces astaci]
MKRTADCLFSFLDSTGQLDRYNDDFLSNPPKKSKPTSLGKKRAQEEMDNFLWELELLQVEAQRTKLLVFTCERELEAYATLHDEIDKSILTVTSDIDRLKGVVANEKIIRSYKEEYETAARVVNENASAKQSAEVVEGLEDQLRSSTEALQAITDRIDLKSKEVALLLRAIRDLESDHHDPSDQGNNTPDQDGKDDPEQDAEYESKHTDEKQAHVAAEASPLQEADDDAAPQASPPPPSSSKSSSKSHRHRHRHDKPSSS